MKDRENGSSAIHNEIKHDMISDHDGDVKVTTSSDSNHDEMFASELGSTVSDGKEAVIAISPSVKVEILSDRYELDGQSPDTSSNEALVSSYYSEGEEKLTSEPIIEYLMQGKSDENFNRNISSLNFKSEDELQESDMQKKEAVIAITPSVKVEMLVDGYESDEQSPDTSSYEAFVSTCYDEGEEKLTSEPIIEYLMQGKADETFNCNICLLNFKTDEELQQHVLSHAEWKEGRPTNENFPFQCHICYKGFWRNQALKYHFITHTEERPHACDICEKAYRHRSALYKHKKSHSEAVMHPCDVCGKLFKNKSYLNIHSVIHTQNRPFSCDICGSTFRDRSARNKHVHAHSGIKPFGCEICGKCFGRKGDYKSHLLVHSEERPYNCPVCNQAFRSSSNCRRHARTHTNIYPHKCDECDKAFNQSWRLREHKFVHSRQMPFVCEQCGVGFRYKRKLKQHQENHARERLHNQNHFDNPDEEETSSYEIIAIQPDISSFME